MLDKDYQLSRQVTYRGMIWLLAAQVAVMLPFAFNLPAWLMPVMLIATLWRIRVIKGHNAQPKFLVRMFVIGLGVAGVLLSNMTLLSLNTMVSFLLLGFAFKSLEVVRQRDALVVVFIGYFLVAISFLFSQSILAAIYGVFSLIILTAALIANQQSPTQQLSQYATRSNLSTAALMLLQCVPLMALIFVLMPRFSPLWVIPGFESQAKTGVSDTMSPGDIANLSKTDELAFRVRFSGRKPAADEMYWRGLTLSHFDGVRWRQLEHEYTVDALKAKLQLEQPWQDSNIELRGEPIHYEAIYEKTGQPWLFTLTPTTQAEGKVLQLGDYRVMSRSDLQSPLMMKATSYPDARRDLVLSQYNRHLALQLPSTGNPKAHRLARQWHQQAGTDQAYIDKVLAHFNQQNYYYTLRPPTLGNSDTIDKFLFETQRGFCSHYASSFVFLMRAAGMPARVVVGYLGGEWNEASDYFSIRQYDAHAWAEVWLEDKGWTRIDPTASVAPSRVEGGLEAAVEYEGSFLEGQLFSVHQFKWMNGIRKKMDAIQYGWRRWILGYDSDSQANLLKTILDKLSSIPLALLVGLLFVGIFLLWFVMLGLVGKRRYEAYEHRLYRKFCKQLEKQGIRREPQQTPLAFAKMASQAWPDKADIIQSFSLLYQQLCYQPNAFADTRECLKKMRGLLRRMN
ncbi:MAG: transglutaminase [Proteobacteria bacterium]|nr:MAG: transglutaminase [Pseudomonadota bacterium]